MINENTTRGDTIRIIHSSNTNVNWINKVFNLSHVCFSKGLFGRSYCEVEFTISDENIKPTDIMDKTIVCEIVLTDDSRYLVSDASSISILPNEYSELTFCTNEFKISACFDSWAVAPTPELVYKGKIYTIEPFDIGQCLESSTSTILSDSTNVLCKQISEQIGIDFGYNNSQTATAQTVTSLYRADKAESINYRYIFKPDYNVDSDGCFNKYNHEVYKPEQDRYGWDWTNPIKTNKKEKENDIMKINDKELKQIIIDEDRKTVTTITTDSQTDIACLFNIEPKKYVTVAKASKDDDFDLYVGVAMTLAYQLFGSKENFRKFVRENKLVKNLKKEREAREAARRAAKVKAEEDCKKAAARKAKKARRDAEIAAEAFKKISKYINEANKKTKTKKTKTEKDE